MSATTQEKGNFILNVTCPARAGIVAAISGFLFERGCYVSESAQYDDQATNKFFMRTVFRGDGDSSVDAEQMRAEFAAIASQFEMDWQLHDASQPPKVIIMVSKFDHCLDDLLYRHHKGELFMDIVAVVSNHKDLRGMAEREGIRFVHLPVNKENKPEQEARLMEIVDETGAELVVLARYMQVLSDDLCRNLSGRAINIHHSFLPGFKGAKPYHQAHARGVKLIGATAHYVTGDLDEGPIIEQAVQRVDHTYQPAQLVAVGRDTENTALAKAVKFHLERRVFLDGNKTVVFR